MSDTHTHDDPAPAHGDHDHTSPAEEDRTNSALIFGLVAATLVLLAVVVAGVNELFKAAVSQEISDKVLDPPNPALRALRAMEQDRLSRYQWVSEKDGILRIPIDRAALLTLRDRRTPAPGEELVR